MTSSLIGIDLNAPIHRIFQSRRLLPDLLAKRLTLVRPDCWDDPFEYFIKKCTFEYPDENSQFVSHQFGRSPNVFAQCWSVGTESDAMWRMYSNVTKNGLGVNTDVDAEGIKVCTTPKKLLSAIVPGLEATGYKVFVGLVQYETDSTIHEWFADEILRNGLNAFNDIKVHAESLLQKRLPFIHEAEARLICIGDQGANGDRTLVAAIEAEQIFGEIILDPRITAADVKMRTNQLRETGFIGTISQSQLYQDMELEVCAFNNG